MKHLNKSQRYTIYRMRKDNKKQSEIVNYVGVSQATISKELKRNSCSNGHYTITLTWEVIKTPNYVTFYFKIYDIFDFYRL